ncbi:MAG: T9SS type A sorting domain-containing protein [Saprospiraceae bacterium]|nr:T9SS type A sorting domain-containing protein [Saprospiraceae bacterium]
MIEKDNKVYFQSGNFIRYTDNGGFSWKSIILNGQYKNMAKIKDKLLLFSAKDGCFLFDDSTNSYLPASNGLNSSGIRKLWAGDNSIWAQLYSDNSIHKYDLTSGEWSYSGLPISAFPSFPFLTSASGYFLYDKINSGEIYISANLSTDWDTLTHPFGHPHDLENYFWIGDYIYIQGGFNQKYISKDFGVTWLAIPRYLTSGVVFKDQIWAIDSNGKLIVSKDDAQSWEELDNIPEGLRSIYVTEARLFLITVSGNQTFLFSSIDGVDWEFSGDGLSINEIRPNDVVSMNQYNGIYYLQTERSSLFYSVDKGRSWERIMNPSYESMTLLNDTVYIGQINGGGVFKSSLSRLERQMAKGCIFHDLNGDGIKDPNEKYISDVQIMINTVNYPTKNYFTLSDEIGQFEIRPSFELNDTLRPNLFSEYVENIEPPFYITHDSIDSYDFAVSFRPNITDGSITGTYNRQPGSGNDINIHLQYKNTGTVPFSGVVSLKMDPAFNFIQSTPQPTAINMDSLIWRFEDLAMFEKKQILVEGKLSYFLETDSLIKTYAHISPDQADENILDNFFIIEDKVGSNSNTYYRKRVHPEQGMTEAEMKEGKELVYTIYFQNPSNVEVKDFQISDVLAPELDVNSIRIIGSSHNITKWELLPSRILRVYFENANLPPTNPDAYEVDGFFKFGIRIRKDNNPNFYFQNTASIIFDNRIGGYTNTVQTRWTPEVTTGIIEVAEEAFKKLSIIPNPASQNCYLSTNGRIKGKGIIRIFNTSGRSLSVQQVQDLSMNIELQTDQLMNGFYLITVEGAEGIMHGKLIVQK